MEKSGKFGAIGTGCALLMVIAMLPTTRDAQAQGPAGAPVRIVNIPEVYESSKLASNLIELECGAQKFLGAPCFQILPGDGSVANYKVPEGMALVITSVQINPATPATTADIRLELISGLSSTHAEWTAPGGSTTVFNYPSGLVLGGGYKPEMYLTAKDLRTDVYLRGYLSPALPTIPFVPGN